MKLPKTINICGIPYKIVLNPEGNGGSVDYEKVTITIGTQYPLDVAEVLLHEVIEATMVVRNLRYALEREECSNDDYLFSFNHKEFEQLMKDVSASLKGISFK